ncbi:hypothetical protein LINPERHAP2_LOCUS30829 [Linum perenne]
MLGLIILTIICSRSIITHTIKGSDQFTNDCRPAGKQTLILQT